MAVAVASHLCTQKGKVALPVVAYLVQRKVRGTVITGMNLCICFFHAWLPQRQDGRVVLIIVQHHLWLLHSCALCFLHLCIPVCMT